MNNENSNLKLSIGDNKKLMFLWWEDDEHGVFMTRDYFEFMERFYFASNNSLTFGEFWNYLEESDKEFVGLFLEVEDNPPNKDDLIEDLIEKLWIFDDQEFPITQCAEETHTNHTNGLVPMFMTGELRTEYGHYIGYYPKSTFVEMKEEITELGYEVESLQSPFSKYLYHYRG